MEKNRFEKSLSPYREQVDSALVELSGSRPENIPLRLWESMTYSLLAGGKRIRPILCLLSAGACGVSKNDAMVMALACEMVHTASLIHDDLPAMDNDILRRGKPTNHVIFGEPLSLIAGDALFLWAFEFALEGLAKRNKFQPETIMAAVSELLKAAGPKGICGGQVLDSDPESTLSTEEHPWRVAFSKTASLIRASVLSGVVLGETDEETRSAFSAYGEHLGMAFQIVDDIIDVTGSKSELGKTPGKDSEQGKITFVAAFGMEKARQLAARETSLASRAISRVNGETDLLASLPGTLLDRSI